MKSKSIIQGLLFIFFPLIAFVLMSAGEASCGSGGGTSDASWTGCTFYWWRGSNYTYNNCQFPYTCDYNYIDFYQMTQAGTISGYYKATITITPATGQSKTWSIYLNSPNNGTIQSSLCLGSVPQGYMLNLQRPTGQSFTVNIQLWLKCSDCGAGPGTAQYWSQTYSHSSTNATTIDELAPSYIGLANC